MAYTFKQMKKGNYFGNVNDHSSDVYQKVSTYEFSDVRTGEVFDIRKTGWAKYYDSDFGVFCLAEVKIRVEKVQWRPEW